MQFTLITHLSRRRYFLCIAALLLFAASAHSQTTAPADDPMSDDPAVEKRLLQLPEGFDIQLYASEPQIINPVTMNFDAQGRLWILCLPGYPHILPGQEPRDFITVIDPPTDPNQQPKSHTFATGLMVPTGLIPGDGGVYLGEGDSLLHLKDTDNDGKADQRRLLLSGFGTQDMHHTLNTFRWGPDGFLYFDQGVYILSSVETPTGLRRQFGGCMWQFRPGSLALEIYDRSIYQNNTWGHVFDDWGNSLIASAWPADINLLLPDTPLNDSNDPNFVPPLPMTKLAGDRHSGMERITGRHFPAEWQNNLVTGGFQSQQVNRFTLEDDGQHLSSRQLAPLIISHHRKFRPVDLKMGPDGALYLADWYNLIIQHNQVDFRDPRRGHSQGRIWRITYKGRPLVPIPNLQVETAQLLEHLKDPEQWTRDQTRRTLAERNRDEVKTALAAWVQSIEQKRATDPNYDPQHDQIEALWTYQTIDVIDAPLLKNLLRAVDPRARAAATTVLGYWFDRVPGAIDLLTAQANDENIRVRLNAVLAAQRIPSAEAFAAAMHAADHPTDAMLDFELKKIALVLQKYWYPAFQSGKLTLDNDPRQISFALMAIRAPEGVPKLLELFSAGKIPPERQVELLAAVAATGNALQVAAVLDAAVSPDARSAADRTRLLDALADAARARKIIPESDLNRIAPLIENNDALALAAMRLAGIWQLKSTRDTLTKISEDPKASSERRQTAMAALLAIGADDSTQYLTALAKSDKPYAIRTDAVMALAAADLKSAVAVAAQLFQNPAPATGPDDPAPLFNALLHRDGAPDALAEAMKQTKPNPDVAKIGLRELTAAGASTSPLATVLREAASVAATRRQNSPEESKRLVALVASHGDPARGEQLFRSNTLGCMRCHAIAGAGGNVGPDLAAVGTSAQPDFLVEHILTPGKKVKDGYTAWMVDTKAGETVVGIQLRETADQLVLRDATHDEITIPKSTIKRQRPVGTLMPTGFADALTDGELADLVRFLTELGKPGPYSISHNNLARRWWTLAELPAPFAKLGEVLRDNKQLPWTRAYTNVAGEIPLTEVAIPPTKSIAHLRCAIDVTAAGKLQIALNTPEGLHLWIDGAPLEARDTILLDLTTGRHTIDFRVNLKTRKSPTLRCELIDLPTSPARAQWSPN